MQFDSSRIFNNAISLIGIARCQTKQNKTNYLKHDQFLFEATGNLSHSQEWLLITTLC